MTNQPKYTMCYLGKVNRFDRDQQLELCQQIVDKLNLGPIDNRIYEHNELAEFTKNLRGNEAAVIPLLSSLGNKKGSGAGVQFFINERSIHDRCQFIVSLDTTKRKAIADLITVQSDSGKHWYALLQKTSNSVMRGQPLKRERAKSMGRKRHAKPGLVQTWELKEGTAEYLTHAYIWGNLKVTPAANAISQFPDDELRAASEETIRRIFKARQECAEWLNNLNK